MKVYAWFAWLAVVSWTNMSTVLLYNGSRHVAEGLAFSGMGFTAAACLNFWFVSPWFSRTRTILRSYANLDLNLCRLNRMFFILQNIRGWSPAHVSDVWARSGTLLLMTARAAGETRVFYTHPAVRQRYEANGVEIPEIPASGFTGMQRILDSIYQNFATFDIPVNRIRGTVPMQPRPRDAVVPIPQPAQSPQVVMPWEEV